MLNYTCELHTLEAILKENESFGVDFRFVFGSVGVSASELLVDMLRGDTLILNKELLAERAFW